MYSENNTGPMGKGESREMVPESDLTPFTTTPYYHRENTGANLTGRIFLHSCESKFFPHREALHENEGSYIFIYTQ